MKVTAEKNERVGKLIFASIYPHYVNRLEKNGRTKEELHQVIEWLTGYNQEKLLALIEEKVTFKDFFQKATATVQVKLGNFQMWRLIKMQHIGDILSSNLERESWRRGRTTMVEKYSFLQKNVWNNSVISVARSSS